ncbi:MAG TPA: TnsD family Tn7-like transposition protein [Pyrinomonadaceae bacterium]|nr:TnsD family Tn7-like transposition protein [Pyrinomonadaceae bacterium]
MIGFFTDPHPDELLYSAISRYHYRARNGSTECTARELFGHAQTYIIADLQSRLDYLASQLPPQTYPVSQLIDEHTILPYFAPFISAERHEEIRLDMRGEGGGAIHARLGILTSEITVEYLRFCPACAEKDEGTQNGGAYWHRVHQLPGIEACPTHAVFLINSVVRIRGRSKRRAFITARQAIAELPAEGRTAVPLDLNNKEHQILLRLAKNAEWLLKAQIRASDLDSLRSRYLQVLFEKGVAGYNGKVKHSILEKQFLDYYPPGLLSRLRCGLELRYHWLRRLINEWGRARHPFHHLLLIEFLNRPIDEFFQGPVEFEPFGKGPWPCLNRAAGHYMEPRITECHIRDTWNEGNRLIGNFYCDCGFAYRRLGPDSTEERRFQQDGILSLGETWHEKLRSLLVSGRSAHKELAREFNIGVKTISNEIQLLKETEESGQYEVMGRRGHHSDPVSSDTKRREAYRSRWRKIVTENPGLSRSAVACNDYSAYNWLLKHDKEWFNENSPALLGSSGTRPRVNWQERDEKYSVDVRKTAEAMLKRPGRPIRASRAAIVNELGIQAVVDKQADKLQLTNKTLDQVAESHTSFAIRRVRWAADCFRQEQCSASNWQIASRAAVSYEVAATPEVKEAIIECVRALKELKDRGWE